jgi:3-hydroxy-9,10-secoandrosta-1,3,5(10)-triene-9,17-dione monooxygenase reductase component
VAGGDIEPDGDAPGPAGIEQAELRTVLGHFASGVVVVTGLTPSGPAGLTCQSFFSLSLDPPLVAFAPSRASRSWPMIEESGACTVNVLAERQEPLARAFSLAGSDKFAGVGWAPGTTGAPRLHDALAWLDCRLEHVGDGGDHHLVVASVAAMDTGSGEPLLFYRGGYGGFRS